MIEFLDNISNMDDKSLIEKIEEKCELLENNQKFQLGLKLLN